MGDAAGCRKTETIVIVEVAKDGSVALLEPEDTRAFKLVAPREMDEHDVVQALRSVADVEFDHAWVRQAWIRETSPLASSGEWQASFAKMLDYARSKGWLRPADEAIRAHIERI